MPQIPAYDGPQVGLKPVNYDQASADSFGGVQARQLTQLGQGMQQAGQALDVISDREIQTQVFNAEAAAKDAYTKWQQEATKSRQGEAAKGLAKDSEDWWGKASQDYGKDLSPAAQRMLQKAFTQQRSASLGQMAHYENSQLDWAAGVAKTKNINASITRAVTDPSADNIATQKNNIIGVLRADAAKLTPEAYQQTVSEAFSTLHTQVFNSLVVNNPQAAQAYFKANDKEFVGEQRVAVTERLKTATAAAIGRAGARSDIAELTKGLGKTDSFPDADLDAMGVKRFTNEKGEVDEAALDQFRHEVSVQSRMWADRSAKLIGDIGEKVTGMMGSGMSWAQIQSSGLLDGVSQGEATKIKRAYQTEQIALYSQDVHRRELALRDQELRAAPKMWEYASDPAKLAALTEQEVRSLYTEVGFANASRLAAERQQYVNNRAKLEEAKIDADMFKTMAEGSGFNIDAKKGESYEEVLRLRDSVSREVRARQQKLGRPLFDEEKRDAMQSVIDNKVILGTLLTTAKPVDVLTEDQLKEAKVAVYETQTDSPYGSARVKRTIPLASIPGEFRKNAIKSANKFGNPVTESNIAQAWFDAPPNEKKRWMDQDAARIKNTPK